MRTLAEPPSGAGAGQTPFTIRKVPIWEFCDERQTDWLG